MTMTAPTEYMAETFEAMPKPVSRLFESFTKAPDSTPETQHGVFKIPENYASTPADDVNTVYDGWLRGLSELANYYADL
jgi:hypothetical protein